MTAIHLFVLLAAVSPQQASPPTAGQTERVAVPPATPEAMAYYRSGNLLWVARQATSLAIPALVLLSGFSVRLRNWACRIGHTWFFVILVYFVLYAMLQWILEVPLAFYAGYVRQHAYGLSNQSFGKWLYDLLVEGGVELTVGALLIWMPYWLIRRSPTRWWLYTAILSLPVMFFVMLVEPIWVAPLFNHFGPMRDKQLEAQILDLAQRAGIQGSRVFEVDKSVDTKALNAYVTGFGASKRIVLWDTLLEKLNAAEVRVVMAHEMGHYVLNHVAQGLLAGFCGVLIGLWLVHHAARWLLSHYKNRLGFDELSDVASLPLLVLLVQLAALTLMPPGLAFSRHLEHEADRFALELTHDNRSAALAFVRIQDENLGNPRPGPLYMLLRATHPSTGERIDFANDYRPWERGEPLHYEGLFTR